MTLEHYRAMLAQSTRMRAFRSAIENAVQPGSRVLEVGCGLGTYAMFAARAGAQRVWAIEGDRVVQVARHIARENDLADRIEFLVGWYPDVEPPEPADLVVFEDYGPRLMDARTHRILRHFERVSLATGGHLLPARARIWIAPVHAPRSCELVQPFAGTEDLLYGFDWESSRYYVANKPLARQVRPEEVIAAPVLLADVPLLPAPTPSRLSGEAEWTFAEAQEVHGLAYWFDLEVEHGAWLTNAPGGEPGSWGHLYLPADRTMPVAPGERFSATVGFDVGPDEEPSWMHWTLTTKGHTWSAHEFASFPATAEDFRRATPEWTPDLGDEGRATLRSLELADGRRAVGDIVSSLIEEGLAKTREQAEQWVARALSGRAS